MSQTNTEIKERRKLAGLTQQQAADLVYVSASTWRRWERGVLTIPKRKYDFFMNATSPKMENTDTST